MTSIITGDIINSQASGIPENYLIPIREALSNIGKENKDWEVFRGDSFQVEVKNYKEAFWKSVYLKASVKSVKNLDVRIGIGVGEKTYKSDHISEANGPAFINSGEIFETLKQDKINLRIKTQNPVLDEELNIAFRLALIAMDNWTPGAAEIVKLTIENPNMNQQALGKIIGIKQNTVSERQKRAFLGEIQAFDQVFRNKITQV